MARILIIDDSEEILTLCKRYLETLNHDILLAKDGFEGLDYLYTHMIDVLLLDINMPFLNGFQLLERIKRSPRFKTLVIAMLTARADPKDITRAKNAGIEHYIVKPIVPEKFIETVNNLIPKLPISQLSEVSLKKDKEPPPQISICTHYDMLSISELGVVVESRIRLEEGMNYSVEANYLGEIGMNPRMTMVVTSVIPGKNGTYITRLGFPKMSTEEKEKLMKWIKMSNYSKSRLFGEVPE